MRILLLSCSTGEGHNSTAKAIAEALNLQGAQTEIQDALGLLSPRLAKFISNWHARIYRYVPKLFSAGYKMAEMITEEPDDNDLLYESLALGVQKVHRFLEEGQYDAVVCTHVFAGMLMTEHRREWDDRMPWFEVATDYSCVPYTEQCQPDGCFIPTADQVGEFVAAGLPRERLLVSGIPIRQMFYEKEPKVLARQALALPAEGPVVLIMGGSMGCGPMAKIARTILGRMPEHGSVVTVCGRNERLYESLTEHANYRFRVLGFTQEVSRYMDAADLIVTKPGGLSSTEAANKHLPMVFIHTVGGCENYNFQYFLQKGYAVGSKHANEVVDLAVGLMRSPERLERMRQQLSNDFTVNSAVAIARQVIAAAERRMAEI